MSKFINKDQNTTTELHHQTFSESILKAPKTKSFDKYEVSYIPCTTNDVERFFSLVKNVYTENRQSMDPLTLESIMLAKLNRVIWGINSISTLVNSDNDDI